jgi:excisionase family DNA binding protein
MPHPNVTGRRSSGEEAPNKRALTVDEFGEIYGPGRTTTYELIKGGHLKALKLGRKTLILRESADAWLESLPALNTTPEPCSA